MHSFATCAPKCGLSLGIHFLSILAQTGSGTRFKKTVSFFSVWRWVFTLPSDSDVSSNGVSGKPVRTHLTCQT